MKVMGDVVWRCVILGLYDCDVMSKVRSMKVF